MISQESLEKEKEKAQIRVKVLAFFCTCVNVIISAKSDSDWALGWELINEMESYKIILSIYAVVLLMEWDILAIQGLYAMYVTEL